MRRFATPRSIDQVRELMDEQRAKFETQKATAQSQGFDLLDSMA